MEKVANYIQKIEIDSLWSGRRHVEWILNRHVNILSGVNGVGKSTILNRVVKHLMSLSSLDRADDGVTLTYDDPTADRVAFNVIRSFDRPLVTGEGMNMLAGLHLRTELDVCLYMLQREYLDYQVNLSTRMLQLFTNHEPDAQQKVEEIAKEKSHFMDVVDELFADTHKKIIRDKNEIAFDQHGEEVGAFQLSSGEKQMLIILLTVLVQNRRPCVLLMDEPEVSLHVEWQQRLVALIRDLNPSAQIILTTHSPAVIMDGWMECVTDVEDIVSD